MRFSEILAASLVAPLVAAHGGVPGAPKILGLGHNGVAELKMRNIFGGHAHRAAQPAHGSLQARQGGADGRCGKDFGCATCAEGYCCSPSGYCGKGQDYCQAPDSLIDYGPGADANKVPSGGTTRNIARPKLGSVLYGGEGIYVCEKPGQIAITYDDGPYIYTNELMDMFAAYNFKATFFMTGINLYKGSIDDESTQWPAMLRRMVADGHQLASHTWSHQDLSAITQAQRYEQIVKLEMAMSNVVGKFPTYMRPPYSSCSAASGCQKDMADLGYHVSYFDLDTDDYNNVTPEKAQIPKDNVKAALASKNSATDEFLVIGHDIHYQTVHNLTGYMLDLMVAKGYKGVTMGECLGDPEANWYRSATGRVATSSAFTPPACASTRASSAAAAASVSASRTSSGAVVTPTGISLDGSCGSVVGLTCLGFAQGECCSQYNYCGNSEGHCGDGCQKGFGNCGILSSSSSSLSASDSASVSASRTSSVAVATPTGVSLDSSCGPTVGRTCLGFAQGDCCSQYNFCGSTEGHCGDGCQKGFGKCGILSSGLSSSSKPTASSSVLASSRASSASAPGSSSASLSKASSVSSVSRGPTSSSSPSSASKPSSTPALPTRLSSAPSVLSSTIRSSSIISSTARSSSVPSSSNTKPSSTTIRTSTRVSSTPMPSPTPSVIISPNGTCGGSKGYTCKGSFFGECCARSGLCGNTFLHCGTLMGCNKLYGKCY